MGRAVGLGTRDVVEGASEPPIHAEHNLELEDSLFRAHLEGASLFWVYLDRVDLRQAHLEGVDLSEVGLEGADLTEAIGDAKTRLPTGVERPGSLAAI